MSVWWSVSLSAIAVVTSWLIGNRWTPAWLVGVAAQVVWVVYAVMTQQWGFIGSAVIFGVMNMRNYLKWKQLDREEITHVHNSGCVRERV